MCLKSKLIIGIAAFVGVAVSCDHVSMITPQGPDGPDGKSAYEVWKEQVETGNVEWPSSQTTVADFFVFIKGEKGDPGKSAYELWKNLISNGDVQNPHDPSQKWDASKNSEADFWNFLTGRDGLTPHIGENGNWFIGTVDTGVRAEARDGKDGTDGLDGKNGLSSYELWKEMVEKGDLDWPSDQITKIDFFIYLKGKDGANGLTPHVGTNGNWYIGASDTGVPARGPKGDAGADGKDGETPRIGENGNWWIGDVDTNVPARGETGDAGANGQDGLSPHIGENGNWFIGEIDTKVPARGETGDAGSAGNDGAAVNAPSIGENGTWVVDGVDTGIPARGAKGDKGDTGAAGTNGETPYIMDGTWWIGTTDTGVPARGAQGDQGDTGAAGNSGSAGSTPYIQDGNWYIDGVDTGVPARGPKGDTGVAGQDGQDGKDGQDGTDGADGVSPHIGEGNFWFIGDYNTKVPATGTAGTPGLSAYELWVKDVKDGKINDKDGSLWPVDKISMADFYRFLTGAKGDDGQDGPDGVDGVDGVDGLTAYEIWKEMAQEGTLEDPKNPGEFWPADNVSMADFYYYLTGAEGKIGDDGVNGLSAYEIWKAELAARAGTPDALKDYKAGENVDWDPSRNTIDDFYEYLRGADGKSGSDGEDGADGAAGTPGVE